MTSQTIPSPTTDQISRAPKVLLHDHLDGGLRPGTIIELARANGYQGLPETDADKLGIWFREAADSGSLERYLETFAHTCAVMQTREALRRVAAECVRDLAEDGVVYAEVRYAPEQHLEGGLSLEEVVEAVNEGFREGERLAAADGYRIRTTALLTAMRHAARALEIGTLIRGRLEKLAAEHPVIADIRGRGAMQAIELCAPGTNQPDAARAGAVSAYCHKNGVVTLTCGTWGNVFRFLPPLAISDALLDEAFDVVAEGFAATA